MKIFILFVFAMLCYSQNNNDFVISEGTWKNKVVKYVDKQLMVKIKSGSSLISATNFVCSNGGIILKDFDALGWCLIKFPNKSKIIDFSQQIENSNYFDAVEPDFIVNDHILPNDPLFQNNSQWSLRNLFTPPKGYTGSDINAAEAWNISTGSPSIIVGVIDTGVPMQEGGTIVDHPDLFKNSFLLTGWLPNPTGSLDDYRDITGHGTHVTGIMAARWNNSIGIAGLASNCKYLIGKSSPNASGLYYAIVDLVQKGAKVINRSGGTEDSSGYFTSAVQYANTYNVTLVASAGNNNASIEFPAALSKYFPNVIAVGATDPFDNKAPYSNHGVGLSVVAPGGTDRPYDSNDIVSTTPTYNFNLEFDEFGNEVVTKTFGFMAGTSINWFTKNKFYRKCKFNMEYSPIHLIFTV